MDCRQRFLADHATPRRDGSPIDAKCFRDAIDLHGLDAVRWPADLIAASIEPRRLWAGAGAYGVLLFLGQGLGPSPGINDRMGEKTLGGFLCLLCVIFPIHNVKEVIRVTKPDGVSIVDFVDDLRVVPSNRSLSLDELKRIFDLLVFRMRKLGVELHLEEGLKFFPPRTAFDWIGYFFCSIRMIFALSIPRMEKAVEKLRAIITSVDASGNIRARQLATVRGLIVSADLVFRYTVPAFKNEASRLLTLTNAEREWCRGNTRFDQA